jgi:hypothetical protein
MGTHRIALITFGDSLLGISTYLAKRLALPFVKKAAPVVNASKPERRNMLDLRKLKAKQVSGQEYREHVVAKKVAKEVMQKLLDGQQIKLSGV